MLGAQPPPEPGQHQVEITNIKPSQDFPASPLLSALLPSLRSGKTVVRRFASLRSVDRTCIRALLPYRAWISVVGACRNIWEPSSRFNWYGVLLGPRLLLKLSGDCPLQTTALEEIEPRAPGWENESFWERAWGQGSCTSHLAPPPSHLENHGHSGFWTTRTPLLSSLMHTHVLQ